MRVKVGNQWFAVEDGQPIAVELTSNDRANIAAMHPAATRYGQFSDHDSEATPPFYLRSWLAEG